MLSTAEKCGQAVTLRIVVASHSKGTLHKKTSFFRRSIRLGACLAALAGLTCVAEAQPTYFSELGNAIARVGVQANFFYVVSVEPLGQNCTYGNVYIAADRKAIYGQLLAAKLAGKRISRIDYSQLGGNGTTCWAEL
jgi:hypothetical protein